MKKVSEFLSENFQFLAVKFSIYLNRRVFVMLSSDMLGIGRLVSIKPDKNTYFPSLSSGMCGIKSNKEN